MYKYTNPGRRVSHFNEIHVSSHSWYRCSYGYRGGQTHDVLVQYTRQEVRGGDGVLTG